MYFSKKPKVISISNVKLDGFLKCSTPLRSDFDILILEKHEIRLRKDKLKRVDSWFFGEDGGKTVYFDDTFLGLRNTIILKDLYEKTTEIIFNKNVRLLDKLYPPRSRKSIKELIDAVISIKQLQKGIIPIHAACLAPPNGNEAILLVGYPNVGKSLAALQFSKHGYRYLSDDVVLVDCEGFAYKNAFPSAVGYEDFLKYVSPTDIGLFNYYLFYPKSYLMSKSKILNKLIQPPHIDLSRLSRVKTVDKVAVKTVYIIENGENHVEPLSTDEVHKLISNINHYCLGEINNPVIDAYNYFNTERVFWIEKERQKILLEFLRNKPCYRVSCNDFNWWRTINEH